MDRTARNGTGLAMDGLARGRAMDLVMDGSDRSDGIGVARWRNEICNGWLGDGLDSSTDWRGSMDWMACDGMGRLGNRQWTARNVLASLRWDELGNGRLGVAQLIGRLVMVRAWQWMAWRRAMDWTARNGTGLAMDGSALRDGLDGSRWYGLGNGWLGVARWIGRLAMGRDWQWMAWLGVARWIGRLAMGGARQ